MFKVNNKRVQRCPDVFIANIEHISHLIFSASVVEFE